MWLLAEDQEVVLVAAICVNLISVYFLFSAEAAVVDVPMSHHLNCSR
jgi:hypothetical protein